MGSRITFSVIVVASVMAVRNFDESVFPTFAVTYQLPCFARPINVPNLLVLSMFDNTGGFQLNRENKS